jgi:hypothetical protein
VIPREVAEYAENPSAFSLWTPDFEVTRDDRYCLVLGPNPYFAEVQRLRLGPDDVHSVVAEIRARVRDSGHRDPVWWLGASTTPPDLEQRLLALGFRTPQDRAGRLVALATYEPPESVPAGVEVRRAESLEDFTAVLQVMWDAFDTPPERRWKVEDAFALAQQSPWVVNFLALLDRRPVAAGRAAYCDRGGLLFGGATLPEARGRGAYRALVRARWDEAVRRGVPALVTQAAPSSEPILRRLGFEEVCTLRRLEDPL